MAFDLNGFVLRPARTATGNASSTNEAVSGVSRDHATPDEMTALGYEITPSRPVEPYADMYRASTLLRPDERVGNEEYIIFAENSSSLSVVESDSFTVQGDPAWVESAAGSLDVDSGTYTDGTDVFYVSDPGGRKLGYVRTMFLRKGPGAGTVIELQDEAVVGPASPAFTNTDPSTGKITLNAAALTALGGGFSLERTDTVVSVFYVLAEPKFWWTKNDASATRFGWDGKRARWAPYRGGAPLGLGAADPEETQLKLTPPPRRFDVGDQLPGDSGTLDGYALVRAGLQADTSSTPLDVLVVSDDDAVADSYPASGSAYDAVVGVNNGILRLNPSWVSSNAGQNLWYSPEDFSVDSTGLLGALNSFSTTDNFNHPIMAPVPGPTDRPFIRLGNRRYLTPNVVEDDASLPVPTAVLEGEFYWSVTTGKVVFSHLDIKKATPGAAEYELAYLDVQVYYDGVSLTQQPVPVKAPAPLLDANGDELNGVAAGVPGSGNIFIPRAVPLPPPGVSGVLYEPDGSGDVPSGTSPDPDTRPAGTGLVRRIKGLGDNFLFSGAFALEDLDVKEYEEDIPTLKLKVKKTTAVTSQQQTSVASPAAVVGTSRVQLRRRGLTGEALYFRQCTVTPSVYAASAQAYSRYMEKWVLAGTETMRFSVGGNTYTWDASALPAPANGTSYTAAEIAASFNALQSGSAVAVRGRVRLQDDVSVEIGWNTDPADFSGHAVLGFLPGWRATASGNSFRWLPDNGASFGVFRSPENLDRTEATPDVQATADLGRGSATGEILTDNIAATPYFAILNPPLEDVPGYDEGEHFLTVIGLNQVRLKNWDLNQGVGVNYDWANDRFAWTEGGALPVTPVLGATNVLQLSDTDVLPSSLSSDAMAPVGPNYGLYLQKADEIALTELTYLTDYVMPGNGSSGQAVLTEDQGSQVAIGAGGEFTVGGTFSNPNLSALAAQDLVLQMELFNSVQEGYLLQVLTGDGAGVYTITSKSMVGGTATFEVSPDFRVVGTRETWRIFEAELPDVYDPTIIADVQQTAFNQYTVEPWRIRLLSAVGTVGGALAGDVSNVGERLLSVRFGLTQPALTNEAAASLLEQGELIGSVGDDTLTIPDVTDDHFENSVVGGTAYFALRIGDRTYTTGGGTLSIVSTFTGAAGVIEVGGDGTAIEGQIQIGSTVLSEGEGESLYYDQLFLAAADIPAGTCEINPSTGEIQISASDATTFAGDTAYLVEELIVENNLDATINPLNGSFLLTTPVRAGQIVETQYFQADTNGDKALDSSGNPIEVIEYLPFTVRLEAATRVDQFTYSFNPTGKTLDLGSESIWVGVELQNFAGLTQATVNADSTITFASSVDVADTVQINYAVLEAFGGEQAFTVSTPPVFRKPLFLAEDQASFTVEDDRQDDVIVGQLGILGAYPFYVKAVSYAATEDETTVTIFPAPTTEAGTRAPSEGTGLTLSNVPVAITVDPSDPVAGGGAEGFLLQIDQGVTPLQPVDKGRTQFSFVGDLTQYAKAGHLLELEGIPYLIITGVLSGDGRFTTINVANPAATAHTSADTAYISVRPVYGANPVTFAGVSPYLEEDFHLFLLGERDRDGLELPGRELVEGVHYEGDPASGAISFIDPNQAPLNPWERLVASYTSLTTVSPAVIDGAIITPKYRAKYLHVTTPNKANRLLGSALAAKYSYRSPDTFYCETLTLESYLSEVATAALGRVSGRSGGAPLAFPGQTDNSTQGTLGLRGEVRDLKDQDRAARTYVELYNAVIVAFEQVLEAIDGRLIGDKDGKFKFFIGRGKQYSPPGYEDAITGDLNPRLIWREIIDNWADSQFETDDGWFLETDPAYDPTTAEVPDPANRPGETDGRTPNPHILTYFSGKQQLRVKNDMDDRILVGFGRPRGISALFPSINVPGLFKDMWENHAYSRLYPERTNHFSRLLPGMNPVIGPNGYEDPGFYTAGRKVTVPGPEPGEQSQETVRTRLSPIGAVANPALGEISNIVEVTARDRHARARIWRYYPEGSTELDTSLGLSTATVGKATLVATPLVLSDFPLKDDGFPDSAQLLYTGSAGSLNSLASGDEELSTPAFGVGDQLLFGKPSGQSFVLQDTKGNGVFVGEVQQGCVLTLVDVSGNDLSGSDVLVNASKALEDVVSDGTGRGDTVFVGTPIPDIETVPKNNASPTISESNELAQTVGDYDIQKDLKVRKQSGEFLDASWYTRQDVFPLPLQDWFGQNPPAPLSCIEGEVEFVNTANKPLRLPALLGEGKDDSGDISIPYMAGAETELALLGEVASQFQALLGSDTTVGLPYTPSGAPTSERQDWGAIYPDEIVIADGTVYQAATVLPNFNPATIYTSQDFLPVPASYVAGSAIGDVRRFDLVMVEVDQPLVGSGDLPAGSTGILSVGEVTAITLETPRFVSTATRGQVHKYTLTSAFGNLDGNFPALAGLEVNETNPANFLTSFDFSSVANMDLDDGSGGLSGGLVGLLASGRAVRIEIYDPDPAAVTALVGVITIGSPAAAATCWVWDGATATAVTLAGTGATLTASDILQLETTTSISSLLGGLVLGDYYDYAITIDTLYDSNTQTYTGSALTAGTGSGSTSCSVDRDRLTFRERVNLLNALSRGSTTANGGTNIECSLNLGVITTTAVSDCTVNSATEVNGGSPLTFLERVGPASGVPASTLYTGTFSVASGSGAGDEDGTLKAMAFEGHGNTPLPFSTNPTEGIKLTAIPSSDLAESSAIYDGTGTIKDSVAGAGETLDGTLDWVQDLSASNSLVVSGDIVVVDRDSSGEGAVKTGTYLVRHAVDTNAVAGTVEVLEVDEYSVAGSRRMLDLTFPEVLSASSPTIIVQDVPRVPNSDTGCGFTSTGTLYLILKDQYADWDGSSYTVDRESVYQLAYTAVSYDSATQTATFTLDTGATPVDARNGAITQAQFFGAATQGTRVSGMVHFPLRPRAGYGLPQNNVVGYNEDNAALDLTAGFRVVTMGNNNALNHGGTTVQTKTWDKASTLTDIERLLTSVATPTAGSLGVRVPAPSANTSFHSTRDEVIYGRLYDTVSNPEDKVQGVADHVSLVSLSSTEWNAIHFNATVPFNALDCLLPGDRITFGDDLTAPTVAGFIGLTGIFLEPSFARPTTDLRATVPHVVSASHTATAGLIGLRNISDFTSSAVTEEDVHLYVRRIRRFHDVQVQISDSLSQLKYGYEMRKGDFDSYFSGTRTFTAAALSTGATNLGDFTDPAVNINGGDTLRILDGDGNLLDSAEIKKVKNATELILMRPGLTASLAGAATFEVYLTNPLIPQEQSCEQLLDLITGTSVFKRDVDYGAGDTDGGEASAFNTMQDSLVSNWADEGVQAGDYIVVDPAGTLYLSTETGARPSGDISVTGRSPFVAGGPSGLDDNRGFYKVTDVSGADLTVDGACRFAGGAADGSDDQVFGSSSPTNAQYAVLPTIGDSDLTSGAEGQQSLRPTAAAVGSSFGARTGSDAYRSLQPFGYRVIRPNSIFSDDAVELVLFMRERTLSRIEEVRAFYVNERAGDYYVFQRDDHIENIGSPTDPTAGAGVVSNLTISSLEGLVDETPFANTSDCLSVLDRRFWILDSRLDELNYTEFADDGLEQRPVLPDLIEDVLNFGDRFRDLRYAWIAYRATRSTGSIQVARRAEEQLEEALQEEREYIAQKKALD